MQKKQLLKFKFKCFIIGFIISLLVWKGQSQFHSCQDLLKEWIEDPKKLPHLIFVNSGKFLNDLGDYNNCIHNSENYVYLTLSVFNKAAMNTQFMGLCAPIQCKEELINTNKTLQLQDILNTAFQNATNTTFTPFDEIQIYSPQDVHPEMDWSNYITIGLVAFLFLVSIVGAFLSKLAPQSKILPIKILKCFSISDNLMKIIVVPKTTENQNLLFLNGMRVISIFWIVLGHDMLFRFMNIKNWMDGMSILTTPGITTISPAGFFAVDVFFWIGGFLCTIGMLEQLKKKMKFIPFYMGSILHRFIRIWPTYMIAILVFWKIAPYFGSGPIWKGYYEKACECNQGKVIWNMIFLDNFQDHGPNGRSYCFGWGWYLAVDFQLFLITPFLMFAYKKSKKLGCALTFLLFLASVITAFVMIYVNQWRYPMINPKMKPQPTFMDEFYYKPFVRSSTYFMGIFSGFIYYEWKNENQKFVQFIDKIKNSILIRILFYVIGIGLTQFVIWIIVPFQQGEVWSNLAQSFYNSLNRVFFLIGVYLLVFAAMFRCKNDPVKFILGHPFFSPFAKVSFCLYLTHNIVIMKGVFSARTDFYWQTSSLIYHIITDIFFSLLTALVLSLLVESPTLGLQKIFMKGGEKAKKKEGQISKKEIQSLQRSYTQIQDGPQIKQRLMKDFQVITELTTESQNLRANRQNLL